MKQILDLQTELNMAPIWRQAFRPFFLFGSTYALLAILVWGWSLGHSAVISPPFGLIFWHSHEMLFGFVAAIIAGFLLTAVQNWTGMRALNGNALIAIVAVWLLGRVINVLDITLPVYFYMVVQLTFWLGVIGYLAKPIITIKQYRNLIFTPILFLLASLDVTSYYLAAESSQYTNSIFHVAVLLILLLMTVLSGRVFPMFTANGTQTARVPVNKWLEVATVLFTVVILVISIGPIKVNIHSELIGLLFLFSAGLHAVRALRWRPWVTLKVPLVWSLHLSYWFIPVGLLLIGLHHWQWPVTFSSGLHAITVGAMSLMILAMISRVSLGHSGRPIIPATSVKYSFYLMATAAIARVGAEFALYPLGLAASVILFALAMAVYCLSYFSILTQPRADGRPG